MGGPPQKGQPKFIGRSDERRSKRHTESPPVPGEISKGLARVEAQAMASA